MPTRPDRHKGMPALAYSTLNYQPKLVATGIHNLTTMLADIPRQRELVYADVGEILDRRSANDRQQFGCPKVKWQHRYRGVELRAADLGCVGRHRIARGYRQCHDSLR